MRQKRREGQGRRKKKVLFRGDGVALVDSQWSSWGLLGALALAFGFSLWRMGVAVAVVGQDLSAGRASATSGEATIGFLDFIGASLLAALIAALAWNFYKAVNERSQIRLRTLSFVVLILALSGFAATVLLGVIVFYSWTASVLYFMVATFLALFTFAENRSPL